LTRLFGTCQTLHHESQTNSHLSNGLVVLRTLIKQVLVHLHEQLQCIVYVSVDCSAAHNSNDNIWLSFNTISMTKEFHFLFVHAWQLLLEAVC